MSGKNSRCGWRDDKDEELFSAMLTYPIQLLKLSMIIEIQLGTVSADESPSSITRK